MHVNKIDFQIIPFRGDYYKLNKRHNAIVKHLIYPIPDPAYPFLGVHLTKMIDGSVTVGPNAVLNFSREEIIKKCNLGGIAFGRISNIEQFSKHPQNQFIEIDAPNGKVKMVAPGAEHNGKHLFAKKVPKIDENGNAIRCHIKINDLKNQQISN